MSNKFHFRPCCVINVTLDGLPMMYSTIPSACLQRFHCTTDQALVAPTQVWSTGGRCYLACTRTSCRCSSCLRAPPPPATPSPAPAAASWCYPIASYPTRRRARPSWWCTYSSADRGAPTRYAPSHLLRIHCTLRRLRRLLSCDLACFAVIHIPFYADHCSHAVD